MRSIIETPFYIISAEVSDETPSVNKQRTRDLRTLLKILELGIKEVESRHEETIKAAFVVVCDKAQAIGIGRSFGQESILQVDLFRTASLIHLRGEWKGQSLDIGTWKAVKESVSINSPAWTYDPKTRTYYAAV